LEKENGGRNGQDDSQDETEDDRLASTGRSRHPGKTFFEMETPGRPSRWNTLL
jgi:hypothetical protein